MVLYVEIAWRAELPEHPRRRTNIGAGVDAGDCALAARQSSKDEGPVRYGFVARHLHRAPEHWRGPLTELHDRSPSGAVVRA